MWYNINDTHLFAKNGERAGRALRLFGKRRCGGEAAACAVPTLAEPRRAPLRREKLCTVGQRRFRRRRKRRKAASEASRSAGSVLSSDGGVGKSAKEENIAKAAVRPF